MRHSGHSLPPAVQLLGELIGMAALAELLAGGLAGLLVHNDVPVDLLGATPVVIVSIRGTAEAPLIPRAAQLISQASSALLRCVPLAHVRNSLLGYREFTRLAVGVPLTRLS